MKSIKYLLPLVALAALTACSPNANTNANQTNANTAPVVQNLREVPRPQKIVDEMKTRGEQDNAAPAITVVEPKNGGVVNSSTVKVKLSLSGDLKGYKPMKNMETQMGNHIHVILDNQPYEAYYNLDREFELRNVADGEHTIRFFPSRPWHESYKTDGAFQMVKFTVKSKDADSSAALTTTSEGEKMSDGNSNVNASQLAEGKKMMESKAGAVDLSKPLLTYSRPKGEYKGTDTEAIMIDFWLMNAKLQGDGGEYRIKYSVDGGEAKFLDKWQPIWLAGWIDGKHTVNLELVDKAGNVVDNGGYNSTEREITVAK